MPAKTVLLNYNKQQHADNADATELNRGVQVLRFNGAGHAEPLAWIDEEPLEVLRQLDHAAHGRTNNQFRIIVLDWNCFILVCKQQDQLSTLREEADPNLSYFRNTTKRHSNAGELEVAPW
jgi:hypothetical protein